MKFAKIAFWVAGIYGVLVITPLYFMFDRIGQQDPPPITHPGFYYGFVGTSLAWQIAFLVIASNPVRLRLMMLPGVVEKVAYGAAIIALYLQQRVHPADLVFAGVDLLLAVLFLIAFVRTKVREPSGR